jgi:hypothetical protein
MIPIRSAVVTSLAIATLAVILPAAGASAAGDVNSTPGPCAMTTGAEGQGGTAGVSTQICMGTGVASVGPASGQVATITGPTITGPATIGTVILSAGNAVVV